MSPNMYRIAGELSPFTLHVTARAHAATLRSRFPFLHFFDGFRTSRAT